MVDLLIKNARIISGKGNPWFHGDIAVTGAKISAIGRLGNLRAGTVIDARGHVVSPGFIDAHSHADLAVFVHPRADAKVMQGVTTENVGLDGFSLSPISTENIPVWSKYLSAVNGSPDVEWTWRSFGEYLDAVDRARPSINISSYAGLGAIRLHVMGMTDRPATPEEIERMRELAVQAMEEGARGVSSGLIYPPNQYQTTGEIARIAEAAARYSGVYNVHLRSEGDGLMAGIDEVVEIGRRSGIHVIITHFKVMGRNNWGQAEAALRKIDDARREGIEVSLEQYPYTAASTLLQAIIPPWRHAEGPERLLEMIRTDRETIKREIRERTDWENWSHAAGWENLTLASANSERNRDFAGKSMTEIARLRGISDPADAALDILSDEEGEATMIMFCMDEEDVTTIMRHPGVNYITDGILGGSRPHPRLYGSFPRILGRYVREKGVLSLEEAVRKMTSLPAEKLRLRTKGVIAEGFDADLVIFDPDTVLDNATYDTPRLQPTGIRTVIVNGVVVVEDGCHTGASAGRTIRS